MIHGLDDGKELTELRHKFCLATRREHVMGQMEFVGLPPVVWSKESLNMTPRTLDGISMIPSFGIDERDRVIYGAVRVNQRSNIPIRSPAITDELSAGFDPGTNDVRQCVGGSVRCGNKECSTGLAFNTAIHTLVLNRVSPAVFSPPELALVDLNGLVRTTDFLRAAFQLYQHCLSAEHTPVSDRVITEVMFVLDVVGRFAAQDVVREVQNLLEGEYTLVAPLAVPD
jgi:hypothetical protein